MAKTSKTSPFKEMFGDRQTLGPGARAGKQAIFPVSGDRNIDQLARTRALAVIRHRHEEELREVYKAEQKYLQDTKEI